jgi:soluble lytic murein transglycosylase-like protein
MQNMRRIFLAAALAAVPVLTRAQATPACASKPDQETRAQMIADVQSWSNLEEPTGASAAQLSALQARLQAAGDDDPGLPALRQDLHDWKIALLKTKYKSPMPGGKLGTGFCSFVNGETRKAAEVVAISSALTQEAQVDMRTLSEFHQFQASVSPFDGAARKSGTAAPTGDSSAVIAPAPAGPDDPARYAKVRQILISEGASSRIVDAAIREALRQHKDPLLVLAVINAESNFNPHAHSSVGARGLMQIMPGTGQGLGVHNASALYDVQTNLRAGIKYLGSLWNKFADFSMSSLQAVNPVRYDVKKVVAAYNAGPGAVDKYGGVPPYRETQKYVKNVLSFYEKLKSYLVA